MNFDKIRNATFSGGPKELLTETEISWLQNYKLTNFTLKVQVVFDGEKLQILKIEALTFKGFWPKQINFVVKLYSS